MSETIVQVEEATTSDDESSPQEEVQEQGMGAQFMLPPKPKITRWLIAIAILVISFLGLMWYFFGERIAKYFQFGRSDAKEAENNKAISNTESAKEDNTPPTDETLIARLFPKEVADGIKNESHATLQGLAQALKRNGFKVYGASTCIYTRAQRVIFGGSDSDARRVFESIYVDCAGDGQSACAAEKIRMFPTWLHAATGHEEKGFLTPAKMREMLTKVQSLPAKDAPAPIVMPVPVPAPAHAPVAVEENTAGVVITDVTEQQPRVENARGITAAGPPLDAPMRVNDPESMKTGAIDRSEHRIAQGDAPKIFNDGDATSELAAKMEAIFKNAMNKTDQGALGDNSYESGRAIGEARVSLEQDPLAAREIPLKEYVKKR